MIANPHVYTLEDGSRYRRADADQLGFKAEVDPMDCSTPARCAAMFRRSGSRSGREGAEGLPRDRAFQATAAAPLSAGPT